MAKLVCFLTALAAVATLAAALSSQGDASPSQDWALYHLQEEHHISNFDAGSFFALHDFNNDGMLSTEEIRRTYGLDDESLKDRSEEDKVKGIREVFKIFDPSQRGVITRDMFIKLSDEGKKMPDIGMGPGHHGDDEYEYEIHHFEKFHDENTKEEDLIHPEDIAHFRKHDEMEDEALKIEMQQRMQIVEANIPAKFRRQT